MIERRRYRRIDNTAKVVFKILDKKEEEVEVINVCAGGVCIPLKEKVEKDTFLEIGIILPGQNVPFYAFAKVIWQDKTPMQDNKGNRYFRTGISFIRMNKDDRKKLINHIHKYFSQS